MTEIRAGGDKSRNEECEYFAFLNNQRPTGVGVHLDNSAASRGCYTAYGEGGHGGGGAIPPLISETIEIFYKFSVMIVKTFQPASEPMRYLVSYGFFGRNWA